ncbi:phage tail tape measure protein [Paenibacillus sp. LC231]|uniref:phage tail tape measure protein n=1 Tax=Paenibacillus sp. LC231 TaxID=1120679 RepID=UPI0008DE7D9D|nr:phage tail tape measure protein [Paenibacillus sp. LC231]OIB04563.1 phage tail tape measure protein [Paenibacillus sp. LC231]
MADDLKIFISARLDMNQSIKDINKQILALSTNLNLRKLHLNIAVDGAIVKTLKSITTATDKLNALLSQNKAITNNVSSYKRLNTVIGSINRNMQSHSDLKLKSKMASEANKIAVRSETLQYEEQKRALQELNHQTKNITTTRNALANTSANHDSDPGLSSANDQNSQGGVVQNTGTTLVRRMENWNIAMEALRVPLQLLQNGTQYVNELDTAMSNLTRATNASSIEIQNFLGDANAVANEIGGLTVNVINSATEWANLGYTINQSKALAKQTLVLQNVGDFDSVEQASKALLSTIKSFGIEVDNEGKNVANIVDIYNEVGNRFGITSQGISEAMNSSAASLNAAGNTIEESVAMITAANTSIQDPGKIGEGLDTISQRLRGIGEVGEGLTEILPSIESKFSSMGLTLKKSDNTYKSTYEIFQELSSVWNQLSSAEQLDITQLIGGDQQTVAASILSNWQNAQGALQAGLQSFGSAARENEIYLDSLQGRIAAFTNAANSFWSNSLSSDFLKGIVDAGTGLIKFLDNLGNTTVLVTGLLLTFRHKAIGDLISGAGQTVLALFGVRKAIETTGVAANTTAVALTGMQRALGIFGILMTVGSLIYSVFNQISSSASKSSEEFENLKQSIENSVQNIVELQGLNEQYKEGNKSQEELLSIRQQMAGIMPEIVSYYTSEGEAVYRTAQEIDDLIEKERKLNAERKQNLVDSSFESLNEPIDNIESSRKKIQKAEPKFNEFSAQAEALPIILSFRLKELDDSSDYDIQLAELKDRVQSIFSKHDSIPDPGWVENILREDKIDETLTRVRTSLKTTSAIITSENQNIESELENFKTIFNAANEVSLYILGNSDKSTKLFMNKFSDAFLAKNANSINKDNFEKIILQYENLSKELAKEIDTNKIDLSKVFETGNFSKLAPLLNNVAGELIDVSQLLDQFKSQTNNSSVAVDKFSASMEEINQKYESTSDKVSVYNKLLADNSSETGLNAKEVEELIKKDKSLIDLFEIENGHIKLNTKLVIEKRNTEIQAFKEIAAARKQDLADQNSVLMDKLKSWGVEFSALDTLAGLEEARATINDHKPSNWQDISPDSLGRDDSVEDLNNYNKKQRTKALDFVEQYYLLSKELGILSSSLDNVGTSTEKTNKSTNESNNTFKETKTLLETTNVKIQKIQSSINLLQSERSKYNKGSKEYRKSLMEEISLLERQKEIIDESIVSAQKSEKSTKNTKSSTKTNSLTQTEYYDQINKYAEQYLVNPNLIAAIIKTESSFNPTARSAAGAQGLMQLMPATAKSLGVNNSYDPAQNIEGGTRHFARLLNKYKGDVELALYAYNAGEGNVDKWIKNGQINNIPFKETKAYAPKVLKAFNEYNTNTNHVTATQNSSDDVSELQAKSKEKDSEIYKLRVEFIQSTIVESDNQLEKIDNNIAKSKNKQSTHDNLSAEWRKEEMSQISYMEQRQKGLFNQNEKTSRLVKQKKITGGEFQQQIDQNNLEIEKIETEIQEKRYAVLVSSLDQYEQKRKQASLKIEASETKSSLLDSASPAYRKELEDQLTLKQEINNQNEAEIQTINEKLQNTKLLPKDVAALKERLELLEGHKLSVQVEIDDIKGDIIESQLEEYSDKIRYKDADIKIIQDNLRNLEKGTPEYTQELMKQIPLIQDKIRLNQAEIAYLEAQTKRTDISIAKRKKYNQLLVEAKENNRSLMQDERSIRMEIADGIIEDYKKAINKQKELELSAIDEKMKAEDERHKEAIKHLDDEYKTFEKYINAQLKAMDRQNASDDYDKELAKKLKERQEIIDKINVLQLDNSMEAKAKRKDLQGQLDAKNEEIDEFKLQRDRETSKQTLQDLLDDRREYLDQVRTHEDDQYEESREKNEQEKKDIERKYNSMLNDEKNFYRIKQGLLSEDKAVVKATTEEIKLFYTHLYAELEQALINHKTITQQEYNNIRDSFNQSNGNLDHYGNNGGTTGGTNGNAADSTITPDVAKAWSNYLGNKKLAEEHQRERMKYKKGSPDYEKISNRIKELSEENQKYRNTYKFKDGSYEELKGFTGSSIFNAASGGMTPAWGSEGKFLLAHEKELILNKSDTSNLLKIVDFTRKIIDSIKGNFNHDAIKSTSTSTQTDNSIRIDHVSIHADQQDTGKSLLEKFETALSTKLKHRTI